MKLRMKVLTALSLAATAVGCSTDKGGVDGGSGPGACGGKFVAGDLIITEIMFNPKGADTGNEWFEIFNASGKAVDLTGLSIYSAKADLSGKKSHTIKSGQIGAGQYFTFSNALNEAKPSFADYGYGADLGDLRNEAGLLGIGCGDSKIDEVIYAGSKEGQSYSLDGSKTPDSAANDNAANWCPGSDDLGGGNFGSPGKANPSCGSRGPPDGGVDPGEDGGPAAPGTCLDESGAERETIPPSAGDLVITEFHANPKAVDDTKGEWFEVLVRKDMDLNGLEIGTEEGAPKLVVEADECISVKAGSYLLFARVADTAANGGLPEVDSEVDLSLTNSNKGIYLSYEEDLIDGITYATTGDGVSTQLDPAKLDAAANDDPANWCRSTSTYGAGDKGTPRAANTPCAGGGDADGGTTDGGPSDSGPSDGGGPMKGACLEGGRERPINRLNAGDLVITEYLANPKAVDDTKGEWFEAYVTRDADLNGLQISTTEGSFTGGLNPMDCIPVKTGSYLVFAREDNPDENGGIPKVNVKASFTLSNSNKGIFLGIDGQLIDGTKYSTTSDGASSQLDARKTDPAANDDPANWCKAAAPFGKGDLGTPGAANANCP